MRRRRPAMDAGAPLGLCGIILLLGVLVGGSAAARSRPVRIAVFDFELDDFSAAAGTAGNAADDMAQLDKATMEARQLLAQSRRFELVDMSAADKAAQSLGAADAAALQGRTLRNCTGCEAAIARDLGAEQSLLGVVSRISRTEYVVRFQTRDARTGALLRAEHSDLRMGAVDSWYRGMTLLIADRLLRHQRRDPEEPPQGAR